MGIFLCSWFGLGEGQQHLVSPAPLLWETNPGADGCWKAPASGFGM